MGLYLKRLYEAPGTGKVVGVRVLRAGPVGSMQHFTPRLIAEGEQQGWLIFEPGRRLVIYGTGSGPLVYGVEREPGYYCCHCDGALAEPGIAQSHVEETHGSLRSPDPSNPAGYRLDQFFACRRLE